MMRPGLCSATALAIATLGCGKGETEAHDSAMHAPAGQAAPDTQGTVGTSVRGKAAADSVGRNPIDNTRVGRDTGRQSQTPAPNKQP